MSDLELVEAFEHGARNAYLKHGISSFSLPHYFAILAGVRAAIAAATGTAKTPKAVECEASQSGAEGNRPKGRRMIPPLKTQEP